jgi:hypothetical protein
MGTSKEKGDILERLIESLCADYGKSKVTRNFKTQGKSGIEREIDVLIECQYKSFDIKIIIESKNYSRKVDIDIVEAFRTKLGDVGGNLGVIVCPLGFTEGAVKSAKLYDIQLYQVFDHSLKNTTQFIPFRYVVPTIDSYQVRLSHGAMDGTFSLPVDNSKWRIFINNNFLNIKEAIHHAWNNRLIPQRPGEHVADFGIVKIADEANVKKFYYAEFKINVRVSADYYFKLFPASFMKNISSGKGNHQIFIDVYSKKEDMIKNGWRHFDSKEKMEEEAAPYDTSPDARGLIATEEYIIE